LSPEHKPDGVICGPSQSIQTIENTPRTCKTTTQKKRRASVPARLVPTCHANRNPRPPSCLSRRNVPFPCHCDRSAPPRVLSTGALPLRVISTGFPPVSVISTGALPSCHFDRSAPPFLSFRPERSGAEKSSHRPDPGTIHSQTPRLRSG